MFVLDMICGNVWIAFSRLTRAIIQRSKQLAARLNEVCDAKQKTLTEKKVALEQLSLVTDHCIDFVNNAVNKGSDMALLFSKRSLDSPRYD